MEMIEQRRNNSCWPLVGIVGLGTFLRFFRLGFHSLWLDEFLTYFDASHAFSEIHRVILASPPLFQYIVHCFELLFGKSDFWLRVPSAAFGSISVALLFIVIDRLFSRRAAIWGSLLYAVSPMSIVYSQELRMYSLLPLLALGSIYFWDKAIREERQQDWLLYAICSLLGLYTHNWFPFLIASQGLWSLGHWIVRKRWSSQGLASFIGVGILYLPWLPVLRDQLNKPVYGHMQIPKLINLAGAFYAFAGARVPSGGSLAGVGTDLIAPLIIVTTILFVFGLWRDKNILRIAIVGLILPLLATFAVSKLGRPIYMANRYTVMCLPVYFMVISRAFEGTGGRTFQQIVRFFGIFWIGSCLFVLGRYYFYLNKAPWKSMVQWMNETSSSNDFVSFDGLDYNKVAFDYYIPHMRHLDDWQSVEGNSLVYLPVRSSDVTATLRSLPKKMSVQSSGDFEDFSVLVLNRRSGIK